MLERWDYSLNDKPPSDYNYSSNVKIYLKCPRGIHESKAFKLNNIAKPERKNCKFKCNKCESIGQYLIDNFGDDGIKLYWSTLNNEVDPFSIPKGTRQKNISYAKKRIIIMII